MVVLRRRGSMKNFGLPIFAKECATGAASRECRYQLSQNRPFDTGG
jgi:hypothetical protein